MSTEVDLERSFAARADRLRERESLWCFVDGAAEPWLRTPGAPAHHGLIAAALAGRAERVRALASAGAGAFEALELSTPGVSALALPDGAAVWVAVSSGAAQPGLLRQRLFEA
jgi:hypothetical protein